MMAVQNTDPEITAVSLWLELTLDGATHTYELDANEARAVAVGSLPRADLRVDRPGVAPVHFHIEREHDALWIVPAYGNKDLRVNAVPLTGPRRVDQCAVIEFANVHIDARIVPRHSASITTAERRCSGVEWKEGSEAEAALLFGQSDSQHRLSSHSVSVEHGAILTAPVQSFLSPPLTAREQPTQTITPSGSRIPPPPPKRGAARAAPTAFREPPLRDPDQPPVTLRTEQSPPASTDMSSDSVNHSNSLPGHDTVVLPPFWLSEVGYDAL